MEKGLEQKIHQYLELQKELSKQIGMIASAIHYAGLHISASDGPESVIQWLRPEKGELKIVDRTDKGQASADGIGSWPWEIQCVRNGIKFFWLATDLEVENWTTNYADLFDREGADHE